MINSIRNNINIAKEYILKARWLKDDERKAKCLMLAQKAINNSLFSLGFNAEEMKDNARRQSNADGQKQKKIV